MIKTSEGNPTLSFTEFKENVEKILAELGHPRTYEEGTIAFSSLIRAYADIRWLGYFSKMHNAYEWGYQQTLADYKDFEEAKKHWAVIYVPYGYDAGPGDFVPQDMPYTHLVIDLYDGEAMISSVLHRTLHCYIDSIRKEAAQQAENEQEDEERQKREND